MRARWPIVVTAACAALLACIGCVVLTAQRTSEFSRERLVQPFLDGEYSQWLIGPVARLATPEEIDAYLALREVDGAKAFIEDFWRRRSQAEGSAVTLRDTFESRALDADEKFSEGHFKGRRTDRGTIFVLYGPPESIEHEELQDVSEPDVELWRYAKKAKPGLDDRKPKRIYRFARRGQLTRFYKAPSEEELRRRARTRPFGERGRL